VAYLGNDEIDSLPKTIKKPIRPCIRTKELLLPWYHLNLNVYTFLLLRNVKKTPGFKTGLKGRFCSFLWWNFSANKFHSLT